MRSSLGSIQGREYVDQFARAVRAAVGAKTDAAALAAAKVDLTGKGGSDLN